MVHGDHGAAIFTVINALSYSPSYVGKYTSTMEHVGNMKMDVMCPKSSKVVDLFFSYGNSCGDSSIESQGGLVQN